MIRVLLCDDETITCDAMALLLSLEDDIEIIGQGRDGQEALSMIASLKPDVALLDLQMPGLTGIQVTQQVTEQGSDCRCIILTSHGLPGYIRRSLDAGARGFVPKASTAASLPDVIRKVAGGQLYVDPDLAQEAILAGDSPLTTSEAAVLEIALRGASIKAISQETSLSSGTTRNYLSTAIAKLGASNRFEAATWARSHGWI